MGPPATSEEVSELLGDRVDESIVERLVASGASVDEIAEAIDDVEHEVRFAERRLPATTGVAEVRAILEEVPFEDDDAGHMTIVGSGELHAR